jgi:serine/threonine-protein kinase
MADIGRYRVLREIGRGGMGVVYEALDPLIGRNVAIKLIHVADEADQRALNDRLFHEARAAGNLVHRNIVSVFDVGLHEGNFYIAMEFVGGQTLASMMAAQAMPRGEILTTILLPVADALDYAHRSGVVHRDVKPNNIMIREDGSPCVVDFGMAQAVQGDGKTRAGLAGGTVAYASPEAIRGDSLDGRADQFSLACVAYEVIAGRRPFESDSLAETLRRLLAGEFRKASEVDPSVPPDADEVFSRALSPDANQRFRHCKDFMAGLCAAVEGIAPTQAQAQSAPRPSQDATPGPPEVMAFPPPPAPSPHLTAPTLYTQTPTPAQSPPPPPAWRPAPRPNVGPGEFTRIFEQLQEGGQTPRRVSSDAGEFTQILGDLRAETPPPEFLQAPTFAELGAGKVRFEKIEGTLRFYRDRLSKQYDSLERQAFYTYILWVCCVALGFGVVIAALVLVFLGKGKEGAATLASSVLVYFIQRIFQQREDQYRKAADKKNEHLEYGNRWLLAIQTIDAVEDPSARARSQARLAIELIRRLGESREEPETSKRRSPVTRKKTGEGRSGAASA